MNRYFKKVHVMSANENPYGPSPMAVSAVLLITRTEMIKKPGREPA